MQPAQLTDNPHVLSGRKLLVFDPHERFQPQYAGGVEVDIVDEGSNYTDQLAAFSPLVSDLTEPFNGTVVRLPLRTEHQGSVSQIRSTSFTLGDIRDLFSQFVEKELEIVILFLKHIQSIELKVITADGDGSPESIGKVEIGGEDVIQRRGFMPTDELPFDKSYILRVIISSPSTASKQRVWKIYRSSAGLQEASVVLSRRLSDNFIKLKQALVGEKLIPDLSLAIPMDSTPLKGRLFTLLPLPISPGFPLHLHGVFALTSDRQHLKNDDETVGNQNRDRCVGLLHEI